MTDQDPTNPTDPPPEQGPTEPAPDRPDPGEAPTAPGGDGTAAECVRAKEPDVVLLDVQMPGGGGVEVIRQAVQAHPDTRFLALSVSDAAEDVIAQVDPELDQLTAREREVLRLIARGYLDKEIAQRSGSPRRRWRPTCPPYYANSSSATATS